MFGPLEPSDLELVERVQNGHVESFEVLVRRYQQRVYNQICRMVRSPEDAADLTQEVFLKVYSSLNRFRGQASFQTWLYRVTANLCVDRHRRTQRAPQVSLSLDAPTETEDGEVERDVADWAGSPETDALTGELQVRVREAVWKLSDKLRAVVVLHDLQGCSYEEIADVLQIPLGTVQSRLFHARAELRRMLAEYVQWTGEDSPTVTSA